MNQKARRSGSDAREKAQPTVAHGSAVDRKPPWLKVTLPSLDAFRATADLIDELDLHTVCTEAGCPNRGECFSGGTATFLILGDRCTRDCRFCAVQHGTPGGGVDDDEPRRLAQAAARLRLRHVVVTSVTRDDLSDGGARQFAAAVTQVRAAVPAATIEVLTPDFRGDPTARETVLAAAPDVFNHNLETVPRLYSSIRPAAVYSRSLEMLRRAASWANADLTSRPAPPGEVGTIVKTGLMLGLGETREEVEAVLDDCVEAGVRIVTLGQYLRPTAARAPVHRYVPPDEFHSWVTWGEERDLTVVAGPFVRSSYRAGETLAGMRSERR